LGPEGGDRGGEVLATGTPETVAQNSASATGIYLRRMLDQNQSVMDAKLPEKNTVQKTVKKAGKSMVKPSQNSTAQSVTKKISKRAPTKSL
jgi:hypothetical protein